MSLIHCGSSSLKRWGVLAYWCESRQQRQLTPFQVWQALYDNPATRGTPEEEAAYHAQALASVAHLTGELYRLRPTTRPEARS